TASCTTRTLLNAGHAKQRAWAASTELNAKTGKASATAIPGTRIVFAPIIAEKNRGLPKAERLRGFGAVVRVVLVWSMTRGAGGTGGAWRMTWRRKTAPPGCCVRRETCRISKDS